MNLLSIIWLVLMVLFLIAEAATVTMISLWFAAGSLAALIVSLLGGSFQNTGIMALGEDDGTVVGLQNFDHCIEHMISVLHKPGQCP